jgi:hypothetical protein
MGQSLQEGKAEVFDYSVLNGLALNCVGFAHFFSLIYRCKQ